MASYMMIILKICEYNTSFLNLFIESIKNNLLFFTIIYVIISIIMYLKTKNTIKKLNEQLRKSRERGKTNEE